MIIGIGTGDDLELVDVVSDHRLVKRGAAKKVDEDDNALLALGAHGGDGGTKVVFI